MIRCPNHYTQQKSHALVVVQKFTGTKPLGKPTILKDL